jgi:hypothetical protein
MKEHAIFVGKVAVGVIVGMIVYNFVSKKMAERSLASRISAPLAPVATAEPATV